MIDISEHGFQFRGYPVTVASEGVMALISDSDHGVEPELAWILGMAEDTAGPDEPSGWLFKSFISPPPEGGTVVRIERFGGIRDTDRHEGGMWSIYLPGER